MRFVPHHVAHAASAHLAAPFERCAVMVLDGRGEGASALLGPRAGRRARVLATQELPHSLGLLYEQLTEHLGFHRSSDEYKVMALASYGRPTPSRGAARAGADHRRRRVPRRSRSTSDASPRRSLWRAPPTPAHADLASSVQARLEEVTPRARRAGCTTRTGEDAITMAGGVALNCVANSRLAAEGPFRHVWVQPAAGDAGTALGAALRIAADLGDAPSSMGSAALGRCWSDEELAGWLADAGVPAERPADLAGTVAAALADDAIVAWFQGRSEWGPRALGHRSLLADPRRAENLERLNDVKGREQFRPVAPMVLADRAAEIFRRAAAQPVHALRARGATSWRDRIPAVVHVDGTARAQTVDREDEPLMAAVLERFEALTGVPVLVNTSLNTAGRPMVDDPRDALECFGSAPVDLLALGPFVVRRAAVLRGGGMTRRPVAGAARRPTTIVVPTVGRPSLSAAARLARLARRAHLPRRCGGRRPTSGPPALRSPTTWRARLPFVVARGALRRAGAGCRPQRSGGGRRPLQWVAFLDDDVVRRTRPGGATSWPTCRRRTTSGRRPGPGRGAAAGGSPADRLGAHRRLSRDGRMDHRRHGRAPTAPSRSSVASTSASPAPTGRTPTSRCGCMAQASC